MKKRRNSKRSSNRIYFILGAIAVLCVVMAVTCPSKEAHKEKMCKVLTNVADDELSSTFGVKKGGFVSALGSVLTNKVVDMFIDTKLEVENYILFSRGVIYKDGEKKTVSFGIFNTIYTFDEEDVKKAII